MRGGNEQRKTELERQLTKRGRGYSILPQPTGRVCVRVCEMGWGVLLPLSQKLDAGHFWSRTPRIYSIWHTNNDGNEYGMITTDSARWAGVKISFNFPRWRLGFEMVGLNLFRYNNVVKCPFLLVRCSVFSKKKTQCEELKE